MYTREESSTIRHKFWTSFGQYMAPVPSASLEKVNWINYKTGIKGISFKMEAGKNNAVVAIVIMLPNTILQYQYFNTFINFVKKLQIIAAGNWEIEKDYVNEHHQNLCKIFIEIQDVNIFNKNDWPTIISFLKKNIMALDAFWNEYKPAFETL